MPKVIPCPILYLIVTNFTCIDGCGDTDDIDNGGGGGGSDGILTEEDVYAPYLAYMRRIDGLFPER